mmetsp:Transcript_47858/g.110102  ORF Transcript_47858/g.110102 Transcript_47858/m.110102 type:complete len:249 (+) Transcript_47858:924-1670(+)
MAWPKVPPVSFIRFCTLTSYCATRCACCSAASGFTASPARRARLASASTASVDGSAPLSPSGRLVPTSAALDTVVTLGGGGLREITVSISTCGMPATCSTLSSCSKVSCTSCGSPSGAKGGGRSKEVPMASLSGWCAYAAASDAAAAAAAARSMATARSTLGGGGGGLRASASAHSWMRATRQCTVSATAEATSPSWLGHLSSVISTLGTALNSKRGQGRESDSMPKTRRTPCTKFHTRTAAIFSVCQ